MLSNSGFIHLFANFGVDGLGALKNNLWVSLAVLILKDLIAKAPGVWEGRDT